MTNASRTLYVGVTNDLERRTTEHKQRATTGFTAKYNVTQLVYYESTSDVEAAIAREKQIKGWNRERKIKLMASANPEWRDFSQEWDDTGKTLRSPQGETKTQPSDGSA